MDVPGGFIPLPPRVESQMALHPLLGNLRQTLVRSPFERALRSVYLYDGVTRNEASTGHSDLDLTLVLRDPPSPELAAQLETACLALQAHHPEISKIDFGIGHLDQARDPADHDGQGYWLKHRCRCLQGEDLANAPPPLRPAKAIALTLSGDYAQVPEDYARRLGSASSEEERHRLRREAARKLIRSSDILCGETESAWPETLEHCLALFHMRHPGQAPTLEYFKAVLNNQITNPVAFIEHLRALSAWMQCQAWPTETVILSVKPTGPQHPTLCAYTRAPG